jgi:hypothetical protein
MKLLTRIQLISLAVLGSVPLAAQSGQPAKDPNQPVTDPAPLPPGWTARPDAAGDPGDIKFVVMEPGYHLTLGPAVILYRNEDRAGGPFHTLAKFHQMKKLKHAEGYGLFTGGQNLDGKNQSYTYFLVRGDGKFTIKRRSGEKATEIVGWKAHPAIAKADPEGKATNLLEIDAKVDPKRVSFKVNGKEVHAMAATQFATTGVVGLRVNHNLDLHVEEFAVHQ